jgi:hypothetical protein
MTISKKTLCHYADCHVLFFVTLSLPVMLSVVMLIVIMLSVVAGGGNVVTEYKRTGLLIRRANDRLESCITLVFDCLTKIWG